ncbi:hypothetical protein SNEBB_003306 [Seison nebaliae]|nr:hypothetical protein SNEBB_003306 [Seison nebaliae]
MSLINLLNLLNSYRNRINCKLEIFYKNSTLDLKDSYGRSRQISIIDKFTNENEFLKLLINYIVIFVSYHQKTSVTIYHENEKIFDTDDIVTHNSMKDNLYQNLFALHERSCLTCLPIQLKDVKGFVYFVKCKEECLLVNRNTWNNKMEYFFMLNGKLILLYDSLLSNNLIQLKLDMEEHFPLFFFYDFHTKQRRYHSNQLRIILLKVNEMVKELVGIEKKIKTKILITHPRDFIRVRYDDSKKLDIRSNFPIIPVKRIDLFKMKFIAQIFHKFLMNMILDEKTNNISLVFLDQHAIHERMRLEYFNNRSNELVWKIIQLSHPIFFPNIFFTHSFVQVRKLFKEAHIEIDIDSESIYVNSIPKVLMDNCNKKDILYGLLTNISIKSNQFERDNILNEFLIKESCKKAVKFGDKLCLSAIIFLLIYARQTKHIFSCCHGRPSTIQYSLFRLPTLKEKRLRSPQKLIEFFKRFSIGNKCHDEEMN